MTVRSLTAFIVTAVVTQGGLTPARQATGSAPAPVVRTTTDPKTGVQVRVSRTGAREFVLDVGDDQVQIRKRIHPAETITTLSTRDDVMEITTTERSLTVSGSDGSATTTGADQRFDQAGAILKRSPAAQAALRLLTRVDLSPESSAGHMLLVTRALLEIPQGATAAVDTFRGWALGAMNRVRLSLARFGARGPGECWDEYEKYIMKILDDYAGCRAGCKWYSIFCPEMCGFEWCLKAQLAFDWLLACSGGLPVR